VYGVVAIYKDHPEYRQLREAYDKMVSPRLFEWHEKVDVEYSDKELSGCELLQLVIIGDAGEGGNEYSHAYEEQGLQMGCELTKYVQIADLTIDSSEFSVVPESKVRRPCDLFRTRFGEFIVSRKFRELAISVGLPGVGFRDVHDLANRGGASDAYFQLVPEGEIGPFLPPSPVERKGYRPECGGYKSILMTELPRALGSEFYFQRQTYRGEPLVQSHEKFGSLPRQTGQLFISGKFYTTLKKAEIHGYWVQPAHLVSM
jgi:hypothetical protein